MTDEELKATQGSPISETELLSSDGEPLIEEGLYLDDAPPEIPDLNSAPRSIAPLPPAEVAIDEVIQPPFKSIPPPPPSARQTGEKPAALQPEGEPASFPEENISVGAEPSAAPAGSIPPPRPRSTNPPPSSELRAPLSSAPPAPRSVPPVPNSVPAPKSLVPPRPSPSSRPAPRPSSLPPSAELASAHGESLAPRSFPPPPRLPRERFGSAPELAAGRKPGAYSMQDIDTESFQGVERHPRSAESAPSIPRQNNLEGEGVFVDAETTDELEPLVPEPLPPAEGAEQVLAEGLDEAAPESVLEVRQMEEAESSQLLDVVAAEEGALESASESLLQGASESAELASEHAAPGEAGPSAAPLGESAEDTTASVGLDVSGGKGLAIPNDIVPERELLEVAPSQPSVLMAMRIISIGEPEAPPVAEVLEELGDEDIAESDRSPELLSADTTAEERAKPPPPPPRRSNRPPPQRSASERERAVKEAQQKRKVRPWWEELYGEDFSRAIFSLSQKQIEAEVDFIEQSLGIEPGGVILDLACGSGEHAVELASRGYAVVGYDLSVTMLAQAQEIAQERDQKLNFLQGDMREMPFDETFDGIYCWSNSFGYFEEEKNINVAQRILKALRPGGTLVLQVSNRDYVVAQTPSSVWFAGDGCVCMDDAHVDWITSRLKVKRTLMLDDGRGKECNYSMRLYSLHELGKLLHDVGFVIRGVSGQVATSGMFLGASSPEIIVLAQRPK